MPLLYSSISRGTTVLANAECVGNFAEVTEQIMTKITSDNHKLTYSHGSYLIHYICEDRIIYMCITDDEFERARAFLFLTAIKRKFISSYGLQAATAMNTEFSRILASEMKHFSESREIDAISRVHGQIDELKDIMVKNIGVEQTLLCKRENILAQLTSLDRNDTYDILVADDMSTIKISNKNHFLILSINSEMDVIVSDHSLPDSKVKWYNSPTGTIQSFFNEFTKTLDQMEEYFHNLNTIDQLCFVVDPVDLSTKFNWRVFKIDEKCFIKVEIDPMIPSSIVVTFIGPTSLVEQYRAKYDEGMSKWDNDLDIHKNLLKIFGLVYFPVKIDHDDEDELNCSICGMFRIPSIPVITCDNMKCDLIFHAVCLKQWCSMVTDGKMFLDVELGAKCPMCKTKISTNFF